MLTSYCIVGAIPLHTRPECFNHKEKALGDKPVQERRRDNELNGVAVGQRREVLFAELHFDIIHMLGP